MQNPIPGLPDPGTGHPTRLPFQVIQARLSNFSLKGREGVAEMVCGELVTGNYFTGLRLDAALGRLFTPEDDRRPGAHPVAVLSHAFWQRRFAGDLNTRLGKLTDES